ncbi:MAG TPA: tetratricopeptide repeat protein [Chryseolinea sp.]|nr:tetratricopeptide repeat protein [Chryseolinea sp.]
MIRFWLLAAALVISVACFSQNPRFINASEIITKGKDLYDSGKYKESIAQYLTIPKRDTGYVYMLSELALSYIASEEYDKALASCEEGLAKASPFRAHFLRSQAIATDRKGDYDKAVTLFTKAIEAYPADFILLYNLGITHYNHKAYEKATNCFFKVLSINPFHPGSHLNLGRLSAGQGKKTHAMLSFGMYLGLNNNDNERLVFMEKYLANQFEEEGSIPSAEANAFEKLDQIIRAKIAMDKNYKSKIDIDAAIVRQYQMFFDQLETASAAVDDRWSNYYLPIYKTLKGNEMIEPFIFHILKSASIDLVKKWPQKNSKKMDAFYNVTNVELKKKRAEITVPSLGFDKPIQAWYYDNNRLEAIGREDAQGVRSGKWVYFKNNFERSVEGMYSNAGKKTGTWKYYNEDGSTRSIENYETGEVNVYREGVLVQHFFLKNDKINGHVELFNACGTPSETLDYDKGRRHGAGKIMYSSGKIKATYNYDSNKVAGTYTNYFENGKVKNVSAYKDDKLEGKYTENYANGKLKSAGAYANDVVIGVWKYYHPNGRLESSGSYKEGLAVGEWNFYDERGALKEKRNFDNDGKLQGENSVYYKNKIHYVNTYKNDMLIAVVYLDSLGKQLGKFGHSSGTFNTKQYYPTGQLAAEGGFKKGKMHGRWQYYFPEGSKHSEFVYVDGYVQGDASEYFKSGGKKYAFQYKDGKFDGKFEEYYAHGQLKQSGLFAGGERQQQWLTYYPDGVTESDYYYLNGELSGLCFDYTTTGKLLSATEFEADRLKDIVTYNASGGAITSRIAESKNVSFESKYKNGKQQTKFVTSCGDYTKITKWFPNGKVFYSYDLLSGQKEGTYQYNSLNGKTVLQGDYINGLEEGLWKAFYDNGKLDYIGTYLSGKHDSTWIYHFPNGEISSIADYKDGERNGITRNFGPDGTPLLEKLYIEGHLVGYRAINSTQKTEEWKSFTGNAAIVINYQNGKKAYEEEHKNGVLNGPKRIYYLTGNLYSEFNYALGDYHGDYRIYYSNGKVREKGSYKLGELDGTLEKYNEDGTLYIVERYLMGVRSGKATVFEQGQKKMEFDFYGGLPYE